MSQKKLRLDVRLARDGYCPSREKAQAAIMAGLVFVDGERACKPGMMVDPSSVIEVRGCPLPYVSRGGLKLEKAIKVFGLVLNGRVVIDVGASTGGFTDCALKHGARLVYAVDVGYGQLAWQLRKDPRVVVLERTNIRHLTPGCLTETPDFAVIDVSFISLEKVLPKVGELTAPDAEGVALVKPQFEAGRDRVGKKGVVREPSVHVEVLFKVVALVNGLGWAVGGLDYSPVTGPEGNIEFLLFFRKKGEQIECSPAAVVERAHSELS
ncbi:predicted rRNA methylase [Pelotomaculum thermopropionicum SI]|uniref:Predicted rRNA methylase n=1 Tax=Pelotomaculum thermopropionicum (strain DSM 13744 / JCM 10971 / SI) TaxID=370438 RepID=A5D2Z7_PELTS|nr:predicted rRNA methylase [Pelotomaculum thermopropionicum SI]